MAFYDQSIVKQIRNGRIEGLSIKTLEKKFGVPETTISHWVRDIPSKFKRFIDCRNREKLLKSQLQNVANTVSIDQNLAKIFVCLLYWCEGPKHPSSSFAFSNSDCTLLLSITGLYEALSKKIMERYPSPVEGGSLLNS